MDGFKKVATIDGQPIFCGELNSVRGYYAFEHHKGMGHSWYTCPVFLGRTKEEVKKALSSYLDWNYRAWHGEMAHILEIQNIFDKLRLPTIELVTKG